MGDGKWCTHANKNTHTHEETGERETQGRQGLGHDVAQTLGTFKVKTHCPRPLPSVLSHYHLKQAGVPKPGQHRAASPWHGKVLLLGSGQNEAQSKTSGDSRPGPDHHYAL